MGENEEGMLEESGEKVGRKRAESQEKVQRKCRRKWGEGGDKIRRKLREWGDSDEKVGRRRREPKDPHQDWQNAPLQSPTDPQEKPGGSQKPPIRAPKSSQGRSRGCPETPSDTTSLFGPFLFPFVSHLGPQKLPQKGLKGGPGEAKRGPRAFQERFMRRLISKPIFQ